MNISVNPKYYVAGQSVLITVSEIKDGYDVKTTLRSSPFGSSYNKDGYKIIDRQSETNNQIQFSFTTDLEGDYELLFEEIFLGNTKKQSYEDDPKNTENDQVESEIIYNVSTLIKNEIKIGTSADNNTFVYYYYNADDGYRKLKFTTEEENGIRSPFIGNASSSHAYFLNTSKKLSVILSDVVTIYFERKDLLKDGYVIDTQGYDGYSGESIWGNRREILEQIYNSMKIHLFQLTFGGHDFYSNPELLLKLKGKPPDDLSGQINYLNTLAAVYEEHVTTEYQRTVHYTNIQRHSGPDSALFLKKCNSLDTFYTLLGELMYRLYIHYNMYSKLLANNLLHSANDDDALAALGDIFKFQGYKIVMLLYNNNFKFTYYYPQNFPAEAKYYFKKN